MGEENSIRVISRGERGGRKTRREERRERERERGKKETKWRKREDLGSHKIAVEEKEDRRENMQEGNSKDINPDKGRFRGI